MRLIASLLISALFTLALAAPPAPAQGPAAADETGATAAEAAPDRPDAPSFFEWMARASGPIGLVILLLSFYLIALVVWMLIQYRRSVAVPEGLVRDLNDLLAQKRYPEAFQRLGNDASFLGKSLAAGVRKLPAGMPAAQRAMQLANDDATMDMEHRTTYLATVGTLGPMIGLVGTVYGMILSFQVMAVEGEAPNAARLAEGISTALFATLEGISLAIPAIVFYAMFRNRIARIALEVELAAEPLLEQFAPGVRTQHPLAAAATGQFRAAIGGPDKPES